MAAMTLESYALNDRTCPSMPASDVALRPAFFFLTGSMAMTQHSDHVIENLVCSRALQMPSRLLCYWGSKDLIARHMRSFEA